MLQIPFVLQQVPGMAHAPPLSLRKSRKLLTSSKDHCLNMPREGESGPGQPQGAPSGTEQGPPEQDQNNFPPRTIWDSQ